MTTLTFLGTGGGRFATIYQTRATGGIYLNDGVRMHIDPGPSALMNLARAKLDPTKTDAILISHCHPDHYADAEMLIEGMTKGGLKKAGVLLGSKSVIDGVPHFTPAISSYHRSLPEKVVVAQPGNESTIKGMNVQCTPTYHSDPTALGFRFFSSNGIISYTGDTELSPELISAHQGSRLLIVNLTRPLHAKVPMHMCTEDAAVLVKEAEPEMAIVTHFGLRLIREGVRVQTKFIEEQSGVRTIGAEDLLSVSVGRVIRPRRFLSGKRPDQLEGPSLDL